MRDLLGIYPSSDIDRRLAELEELLRETLQELTDALGYERAFVALLDRERGVIEGAVGINVPDELLEGLEYGVNDEPSVLIQAEGVSRKAGRVS